MSRHEVKTIFRRTESILSSVEFIGGSNSDGSKWKMSLEKAMDGIMSGKWEFYIVINKHELNLFVQMNKHESMLYIDFPEIGGININSIIINQYCE